MVMSAFRPQYEEHKSETEETRFVYLLSSGVKRCSLLTPVLPELSVTEGYEILSVNRNALLSVRPDRFSTISESGLLASRSKP